MSVPNDFMRRSDQWDIRLNIPDVNWIDEFVKTCVDYCKSGSVRYMHVSGAEVGDVPGRSSFGMLHIHIALILHNYTSKRSIVTRFVNKERGWYVEARDKNKSLQGWIDYHSKSQTKVVPGDTLVFKFGQLPNVRVKRKAAELTPAEEMKRKKKVDDWAQKSI